MTALADILPFTVTSGKYKFRFLPEPEGGFSVSCVNVKGINAQGDTFEDALRDAISAAAFVEECVADIREEEKRRKRGGAALSRTKPALS